MDLKGLVIEKNALVVDKSVGTDAGGLAGAMAYSIDVKADADLVSSFLEMTYFCSEKKQIPLAYLTTTLKFAVDSKHIDVTATETILHAVKTQVSLMMFMLYQKFTDMGVTNYYLVPRPDVFFYEAIKEEFELAPLVFNGVGNYDFRG